MSISNRHHPKNWCRSWTSSPRPKSTGLNLIWKIIMSSSREPNPGILQDKIRLCCRCIISTKPKRKEQKHKVISVSESMWTLKRCRRPKWLTVKTMVKSCHRMMIWVLWFHQIRSKSRPLFFNHKNTQAPKLTLCVSNPNMSKKRHLLVLTSLKVKFRFN